MCAGRGPAGAVMPDELIERLRAFVGDFESKFPHAVALSPFGRPLSLDDFREIIRRLDETDSQCDSWPAVSD